MAETGVAAQTRQEVADWIRSILEERNWTGTELARRAKIQPSTILRFLNRSDYSYVPGARTISKIAAVSGKPFSPHPHRGSRPEREQSMQVVQSGSADPGPADPPRAFGASYELRLENGRISLPPQLAAEAGLAPGVKLMGRVRDGRLVIESAAAVLRRAQDWVREYVPAEISLADELIAERREAAARE